MNYEKKYKSALEWMRSIYPTMQGSDKEDAEHFFPELRESEDEKVRKRLIEFISCNPGAIEDLDEERALAWLENQAVIRVCCEFLQFKRMPKEYFETISLSELDLEDKKDES